RGREGGGGGGESDPPYAFGDSAGRGGGVWPPRPGARCTASDRHGPWDTRANGPPMARARSSGGFSLLPLAACQVASDRQRASSSGSYHVLCELAEPGMHSNCELIATPTLTGGSWSFRLGRRAQSGEVALGGFPGLGDRRGRAGVAAG